MLTNDLFTCWEREDAGDYIANAIKRHDISIKNIGLHEVSEAILNRCSQRMRMHVETGIIRRYLYR